MKKNKSSLRWQLFLYLTTFTLLIFIAIWTFQIFFLKYRYESTKTKELVNAVNEIKKSYDENNDSLYTILENTSYEKGICSEIIVNSITTYTTNPLNRGCLNIYSKNTNIKEVENDFINSDKTYFKTTIHNSFNDNKILIYGAKLNDNIVLFSNTSVNPIDSTVNILKNQLLMITFITIIISIIIAYFIASKLSKPITDLTKKSKELSKGNFNIDFNVNTDVSEIDDLSKSLNYSKNVLKKNDDIRRDLMANVSHDLKTPLTMIKAYAEMIRDLNGDNKEKRENDLNIIIDEVDRLNLLVNDILSLSKLESNIEKTVREEFDLVEMIKTIINRFKIFSITQEYEFIFLSPPTLIIKADKQKMEQVIYNLISNSINYSNESKKIYITILPRVNIRVNISDTGPGIKKEDINKIWDKYYKAEKKHKRNTIGTGLGLSIVKNIFEMHNYKYGVISKKNKGTTFFFEINKKNIKKDN